MKKLTILITLLFIVTPLTACGNKNEINLKDESNIRLGDVKISPKKAVLSKKNGDDFITVDFNWIWGTNEDSLKKKNFLGYPMHLFGEQDGINLDWDIKNSDNVYRDVYEASDSNVSAKFKLDNLKDDVIISFTIDGGNPSSQTLLISLPK